MKVFVSQLFHEASSFVPDQVNINNFHGRHYLKGYENVRLRFQNDKDWVTGALTPFIEHKDDISIGVCTACNPAGVIEYESFQMIIRDMVKEYTEYLAANGPPEVLMLLLHGANLVDSLKDPDAYLVQQFQACAGHSESTVIGVTLDFHGNISRKLVDSVDVVVVGIEYPHVDTFERGSLAANLARNKAANQTSLKTFRFPIPILTALPKQATVEDLPFKKLVDQVELIRAKHNIVDLCVAGGFAFGDCYDVGMNLIAINSSFQPCAEAYKEVLEAVWKLKDHLLNDVPALDLAWETIETKAKSGRVVVADVSDSPGSGGTADETHLLAKLVNSSSNFVSGFHVDPSVVKQAKEVGVGGERQFTFGTSLSHPQSKTLTFTATVKKLLEYEYCNIGSMMQGARLRGGPTTLLEVANELIMVTTERIQAYDINAFINMGIDITFQKPLIIAIKSTAHFRASYTALADQGIELVRASGWSDIDFKSFNYQHRRKPLLPLENIEKSEWDQIVTEACNY